MNLRDVDVDHFSRRDWISSREAAVVTLACSSVSILISACHIHSHLRCYTLPALQVWILRIAIVVPAYAVSSALSTFIGFPNGEYVQFVVSLVEAFTIFSLLNLVMEYCGGEADTVYAIENEPPLALPFPLCCTKPRQRNARLLRLCQKGVLQFVFIKPIVATADVISYACGVYDSTWYQVIEGVIYNVSYTLALYSLLTFYLSTRKHIKSFKPGLKIFVVKSLVVMVYYQSLFVKAARLTARETFLWRNLIVSLEMVLFSACFACAFPTSEFSLGIPDRRMWVACRDFFSMRLLIGGFTYNFSRSYGDYALQSNEAEAPPTVRIRTFFAGDSDKVALEAVERSRGRSKRLAFNSILRGARPAGLRRNRRSDNDSAERNSSVEDDASSPSHDAIDERHEVVIELTNPLHAPESLLYSSLKPLPLLPPPGSGPVPTPTDLQSDGPTEEEDWGEYK